MRVTTATSCSPGYLPQTDAQTVVKRAFVLLPRKKNRNLKNEKRQICGAMMCDWRVQMIWKR